MKTSLLILSIILGLFYGRIGQALNFDGSNDFVQASRALTSTTYSITAWVNPNRFGSNNFLNSFFYQGTASNDVGTRFTIGTCSACTVTNGNTGTLFFQNEQSGGASSFLTAPDNAISLNAWQQVAITKDGATETLYINGVQQSSRTNGNTNTPTNNNAFIGFWFSSTDADRFFQGRIDDVRVYNRALSAAEVRMLYRGFPSRSDLVGHWPLIGNTSGNFEPDFSGLRNHGTRTNGPIRAALSPFVRLFSLNRFR